MNSFALLASPEFSSYAILFAGLLGACVGSFLTLATYRLPRDEPIGLTRSHCPSCQRTLRVMDLLPIFSWVMMRARCRYCQTRIHYRYPLIELACAIGTALIVRQFGVTLEAVSLAGLWWCFVAIVITDLEYAIILDEVQLAAGLFGILYAWTTQRDAETVASAAALGLGIGLTLKYGFIYLRNKDGLGLGDVKFLGILWRAGDADRGKLARVRMGRAIPLRPRVGGSVIGMYFIPRKQRTFLDDYRAAALKCPDALCTQAIKHLVDYARNCYH